MEYVWHRLKTWGGAHASGDPPSWFLYKQAGSQDFQKGGYMGVRCVRMHA